MIDAEKLRYQVKRDKASIAQTDGSFVKGNGKCPIQEPE